MLLEVNVSLCKETSDYFFSCSLISSLWPPRSKSIGESSWFVSFRHTKQSCQLLFPQEKFHSLYGTEIWSRSNGETTTLHQRLPWLVPNGAASASGVTYSRMRHALIFARNWAGAWMIVGQGTWGPETAYLSPSQLHWTSIRQAPASAPTAETFSWDLERGNSPWVDCALLPSSTPSRWRSGSQVKFPLRSSRRADLYLACHFQCISNITIILS